VRYLVFERVGLPLLASVPFSLPPPPISLSLSLSLVLFATFLKIQKGEHPRHPEREFMAARQINSADGSIRARVNLLPTVRVRRLSRVCLRRHVYNREANGAPGSTATRFFIHGFRMRSRYRRNRNR